jgi:chlorophyllide a reductase subunit X
LLATNVAGAPPVRPRPLTQDSLLALFKSDVVGRGIMLDPASAEDMCGGRLVTRPSLEVIYDPV